MTIQSAPESGVRSPDGQTTRLPIRSLLAADSPRRGGEDADHARMLARTGAELPPVLVHRGTMRVIDGTHRLRAALLRGEETIEARLFDGSEPDAFVLAVKLNTAHGLPLAFADRTAAAERIIASHPAWSDRAIAEATGLGATTVRGIRARAAASDGSARRIGRDGRMHPVDGAGGRLRAAEIIRTRPDASLREVAKEAGVSPTTAGDVRQRIRRGEDPVPPVRLRRRRTGSTSALAHGRPAAARTAVQPAPTSDVTAMLRGLANDPALRLSESGRALLRWMMSHAIHSGEASRVAETVPPHSSYIVAAVARRCADEWLQLAQRVERRTRAAA